MANPEKGEYELTVNGTTYTLVLKTAGLIALQNRFSTPEKLASLDDLFQAAREGSIEHRVAFMWAALRKYHPDVTFEQTMDLIDDSDEAATFMAAFAAVLRTATPDPADVEELKEAGTDRPRKARVKRGTGEIGSSGLAKSA